MRMRYQSRDRIYPVDIERTPTGYKARMEDGPAQRAFQVEILDTQPGQLSLLFDGRPVTLYWAEEGNKKWVSLEGCTYLLEKPSPRRQRRPGERAADDTLRAPMPAQVRAVEVQEGDAVVKGQTLLLLEAMKMEIRLQAPRAGRITRLAVDPDQTVEKDQVLLEIGE